MDMKMLYIKHRSGKFMNNFALSAILAAKELGIDFTIANNMSMADQEHFSQVCSQYGIRMVHIDFDRNPLGKDNITAGKQLLELMNRERYDVVHCNTPSGGVVGRICAARAGIPKVLYMAHGFHFWKGAPLKNWLFYYPVERMLGRLTDRLITINREDYSLAKTFRLKQGGRVEYVPGVGIDISRVQQCPCDSWKKREEIGIRDDVRIYTTVAELIPRKNYQTLIQAFSKMKNDSVLLICGTGAQEEELKDLVRRLGAEDRIRFMGFRRDVYEILKMSDVFVFPSRQEGLPVALMEAMAAGLPCVASRVRGNIDLLSNSNLLFHANDVNGLRVALEKARDPEIIQKEVTQNTETLRRFSMEAAVLAMKNIYMDFMDS